MQVIHIKKLESVMRGRSQYGEQTGRCKKQEEGEGKGGEKEDDMGRSRVRSLDEAVSQLIVSKWANGQMERDMAITAYMDGSVRPCTVR